MVANLPQLHDSVLQTHGLLVWFAWVDHKLIVLLNTFINDLLLGGQFNFDDHLYLLRQVLGDVFLDSPEQEWSQYLM